MVVGGQPGSRGVVTAASYEVRRAGREIGHVADRGRQAGAEGDLPADPRTSIYGGYAENACGKSRAGYAPVVAVASIDEMFLDFSGCESLYGRSGDARGGDAAIERAVLQAHRR